MTDYRPVGLNTINLKEKCSACGLEQGIIYLRPWTEEGVRNFLCLDKDACLARVHAELNRRHPDYADDTPPDDWAIAMARELQELGERVAFLEREVRALKEQRLGFM